MYAPICYFDAKHSEILQLSSSLWLTIIQHPRPLKSQINAVYTVLLSNMTEFSGISIPWWRCPLIAASGTAAPNREMGRKTAQTPHYHRSVLLGYFIIAEYVIVVWRCMTKEQILQQCYFHNCNYTYILARALCFIHIKCSKTKFCLSCPVKSRVRTTLHCICNKISVLYERVCRSN